MTTIKESHPTPPKNNLHSDYDENNYSSMEDEDLFDVGKCLQVIKSLIAFNTIFIHMTDPSNRNIPNIQIVPTRKPPIHISKVSNGIDSYENNGIIDSSANNHHHQHLTLHCIIILLSSIILSCYSRLIT